MAKTNSYDTDTAARDKLLTGLDAASSGSVKNYRQGDIAGMGPDVVEVTASETLALTRGGKFLSANHATVAITITVPPNSSVAFPVGTEVHVRQTGAAGVTIAAGVGVTVNQPASQTKVLAEQYAVVTLKKIATDTWALFGMLT